MKDNQVKRGELVVMLSHECDKSKNKCAYVFAGEQTGESALVCCSNISRSSNQVQATCGIPYTWRNGDKEYTSVSDCK